MKLFGIFKILVGLFPLFVKKFNKSFEFLGIERQGQKVVHKNVSLG